MVDKRSADVSMPWSPKSRCGIAQIRTVLYPRSTAAAKAASRSWNGSPAVVRVYHVKSQRGDGQPRRQVRRNSGGTGGCRDSRQTFREGVALMPQGTLR